VHETVLSVIGNTPVVPLHRLFAGAGFEVFAKLEMLNPGGSLKDRPARLIVQQALRERLIGPGSVVIESSSGNMGIGLAQVCRYHGLRFICVVDVKTTRQNLQVLRAYGAEIECVTEPDPETGELLPARLHRVKELLRQTPGGFWPNQYVNRNNPAAHYLGTMQELAAQLDGRIDLLFIAASTCGTITGCASWLRERGMATRVIAVDLVGSLIFSDVKGPRLVPGLGAAMKPPLLDRSLVDGCVHVSDLDCVVGCRRLVAREAILAGGSAGGVVMAIDKLRHEIPPGSVCVAILADRGERYLDTLYSDRWVEEHLGYVEHLWAKQVEWRPALPVEPAPDTPPTLTR
jgi:2,3-diaminopropionate biosynthesis protein SbnA